jgi:RecA/RadA recombinase
MGLLSKKYRETRGKNDVPEARTAFAFKTGLDLLDYKNGKLVTVKGGKPYLSVGVDEGTYIMIVGRSGGGKTALAIQMAASIVGPYENGEIYHDDVEAATDMTRIKALTKWSDDRLEDSYIHRNVGVTAEAFYNNVRKIYNLKMEMKDQLMIKTEKLDSRGNPISIMAPTVCILDSLALLVPEKFSEEEELGGSMSQTAVAKANSMIFQRVVPLLKKANIILIAINHINTKIDINPMQRTKAQVNYMKQDETIPGGNKPIYTANNIFKVDPGSKLTDDKDYGINGFLNKITIIKSRSNRAGQELEVVYDQNTGYDNVYTNFHFLKSEKLISGAGRGFYLEGAEDVKFAQKDFRNKLKASKDLRKAFLRLIGGALKQFIYIPTADEMDGGVEEGEEVTEDTAPKKKTTTATKKTTKKK